MTHVYTQERMTAGSRNLRAFAPSRETKGAVGRLCGWLQCCMLRSSVTVVVCLGLGLLFAPLARADAGDVIIAPRLSVTLPLEWRLGAAVDVGLSQHFAARGDASAALNLDREVAGVFGLGLVWGLDVLRVVPEVALGGGARVDPMGVRPRAYATVGARYFVALDWAVALSAGAEMNGDELFGVLALELRREL